MREITYVQAICEAMDEELARNEKVFLIGEDVGLHGGAFGASKGLFQKYGGKRIRNTPISESAMVGAAVGAAMTGMYPIVEIMYIDFITLAMDQIVNQAAKIRYMFGGKAKLPMVIRTQSGAEKGNAGQHSQSLEAWFMHVPGLKVVMPSTPYDTKGLLKSSIRDENPVIFIEHKGLYPQKGEVPEQEYTVPLGEADIKRKGSDVTVVATGLMVFKALAAAERVKQEGIECEVIDLRTLVPLDKEKIIDSVKKTGKLIIVHSACKRGGIGGEIAGIVAEEAFDYLDAPIKRLGSLEVPVPYARHLEEAIMPNENDIIAAVKDIIH